MNDREILDAIDHADSVAAASDQPLGVGPAATHGRLLRQRSIGCGCLEGSRREQGSSSGREQRQADSSERGARVDSVSDESLKRAVKIIRRGGIVITPSRTNYGLICNPFDENAIRRVFEAKRRTKFGPLIVFISRPEQAEKYVRLPQRVDRRMLRALWPSELAVIFERTYPFPEQLTLGSPTVALCCQGDSPLQRISELLGTPIAGTSANLSGQGDIYVDFDKALRDLGDKVDLVLKATEEIRHKETPVHPGNTIVDLTFGIPRLVRPGAVPTERVRRFFPDLDEDTERYHALLARRLARRASAR